MSKVSKTQRLRKAFLAGFEAPPTMMVSDWAKSHRYTSSEASSQRGLWRSRPFQDEIMDAMSPSDSCQKVVLMCASQMIKTEALLNFLGYIIAMDPGPTLFVEPREEDAKSVSKDRVGPMLRDSPSLRGKVAEVRSRDSDNTMLHKGFVGGHVTFTGAKSPSGLAMRPIRYLLLDEVDRYDSSAGREGDPVALAERRTSEFFWNKKIVMASSPTIEGASRIAAAYEDSDQRKPYVPCPFCGHEQVLEFQRLEWETGYPKRAQYRCCECHELIPEFRKAWMLNHGRWIKGKPQSSIAGFWINRLYSVNPGEWGELAAEFLVKKESAEQLISFVNTGLAETWKEKGEAPDWLRLYERSEDYPIGTVPDGVVFLTAGADVQKDRIEIEIVGWGRGKTSWSVDYIVLDGDPVKPEIWANVAEVLNRRYSNAAGVELAILRMAIDAGYATQETYAWVRSQGPGRVMAVKGVDGGNAPVGQPTLQDVNFAGHRIRRGLKLWPISVGLFKSELYGQLGLDRPTKESGDPFPNGYCHFPKYHEEYFKQLTAEQLVTRTVKGYKKSEWQRLRRNEALDCRVYARAAAANVGLDTFSERRWREFEAMVQSREAPVISQVSPDPEYLEQAPAPPLTRAQMFTGQTARPTREGSNRSSIFDGLPRGL